MEHLTVAKLKSLSTPGLYGDGGTLYLRVAPGGSKSWIQRIAVNGRRRDIGRGGDPPGDKQRAKAPTFREAAQRTFKANRPRWTTKTARNWMQQL